MTLIRRRERGWTAAVAARLAVPFCIAALLATPSASLAGASDLSRPDGGAAPTRVQAGLYLADFYDVSGGDQTFGADLVLLAEWDDPRLAGRRKGSGGVPLDDIWHPRLVIVNQRGVTAGLPQRAEVDPSGHVTYRQRFSGRFTARMDFRGFPRDRQRFLVQVVSLGHPRTEVELVPYDAATRPARAKELSVPDWDVGPARMEPMDFEPAPGVPPLAGVRLSWDGARHLGYYAVQVLVPLVMISLMGWVALWVDPSVVNVRMSTAVTTMLTLIAYRFALGRSVPTLTYLTRFDYFTMGATALVFASLLAVGWCAWLTGRGRTETAARVDRVARVAYPFLFALLCFAAWVD